MTALLALCLTVTVWDGDTIRCDGQRLRIAQIDTPELKGSPACATPAKRAKHWCDHEAGERAKQALIRFIASGKVTIEYTGRVDVYRRPLVHVIVDRVNWRDFAVSQGLARWWR